MREWQFRFNNMPEGGMGVICKAEDARLGGFGEL